jgi:hypothetical protein
MKSIKIGNLVFNKKALYLLLFCLFVNGIIIGASIAYNQENESATNIILLMVMLFMPYLILFKSFSRNIKDVESK